MRARIATERMTAKALWNLHDRLVDDLAPDCPSVWTDRERKGKWTQLRDVSFELRLRGVQTTLWD